MLKATVVYHVAQSTLLNRVLLYLEPIVEVDPEIADKNIERELRFRRDQDGVGIILRMIEIKRISDAQIEAQRVQLGDRPNRIERKIWSNNKVILLVYFGIGDVVVVLESNTSADAKADRAEQKI